MKELERIPDSMITVRQRPEWERIALLGRGPQRTYERDSTIAQVFERQAALTPAADAIVDDAGSVSYHELNSRANQLARYLQSSGLAAGATVGVGFERSRHLPTALLGILKAGCAYVPLDPSYPCERVDFILRDAAAAVVIVERAAPGDRERYGRARVIGLADERASIDAHSDLPVPDVARRGESTPFASPGERLAYIMYTSGSTGRPKGVAIRQRGVVRLVRGADYFTLGERETVLQFAPAAFDASTFEIWAPLLNGARLAIPPAGLLSIDDLGAAVERLGVTSMWLTASVFGRVVEAGLPAFSGLRQLLTGGSAGSPQHMKRFLRLYPRCRLIAGYGPTENTTFSTAYHLASDEAIGENPPIGRPIANSSAYVLDDELQPVALGTPGELWVGGDGVAVGYVNLPELTAQRFLAGPFPFDTCATLYRTGDRARMREDGVVEFLGRTDDQVKINGFRIELGEIESALRALPGIRDAAVVAIEPAPGDKMLAAYVVPSAGSTLDETALRAALRAKLPAYMLPTRMTLSRELPLHSSGKIDRMALAATAAAAAAPSASTPPGSPALPRGPALVKAVADIWSEVLHAERAIDVQANFFDVGGDSLRLLRLHQLLNERLNGNVTVMDLFEHTTIVRIAAFLAARTPR